MPHHEFEDKGRKITIITEPLSRGLWTARYFTSDGKSGRLGEHARSERSAYEEMLEIAIRGGSGWTG